MNQKRREGYQRDILTHNLKKNNKGKKNSTLKKPENHRLSDGTPPKPGGDLLYYGRISRSSCENVAFHYCLFYLKQKRLYYVQLHISLGTFIFF